MKPRTPVAATAFAALCAVQTSLTGCCCSDSTNTLVTTGTGLSYQTLIQGTGPQTPKPGDRVTIHEATRKLDGTLLVSTWDMGHPITITLGAGQAVAGLEECVSTMRVGERREAVMAPELVRRDSYPEGLSPDDALIYLIELVAIEPAQNRSSLG